MAFFKLILLNFYLFFLSLMPVATFTEGVVGQPTSFFPSTAQTQHDHAVGSLMYRSLFKYDIYGTVLPDLAETWTISEDGLVYTIKLKDNQYWINGKKIDADDLIYTSFKVSDLAGVATDKVDSLTVRYTLPNKYSPFLSLLTVGVMYSGSEEKQNKLKPLSSGDWQIVKIERTGKVINKVELRTRSDKYYFKKIAFRYYPNESELVTAAKLGEINAFLSTKLEDVTGFENLKFPLQGIYYALYFHSENEVLKDLGLRQKLEKSLNTSELIFDRGLLVEGPISRSVFTDRNLKFDKFDPLYNEELTDTVLTITVPDIESHVNFVERIKASWQDRLGISVDIIKVKPEDMVSTVVNPRNFQVLFYGQEVGRDPDRYVNWHSTQKNEPGLNISGFEQVRADRALEEGRKELDNDRRLVHYNEFQKVINENVPAIFLYHPFNHYYVSKYITGVGEKYTFTQADRFLDFLNWRRVETN